ncbi:MAG TPA: SDR family NAD(P)-dependent oxidoreductase [Burkholderiaceae bacterium]|nr:SDR family NAD(P)-dependent oxidoreductase [Burkholderiaceae bacterium]
MSEPLCLVTGATSGIGKAIACALASDSIAVMAIGRNRAELDALEQRFPGRLHGRVLDLRDDSAIDALGREFDAEDKKLRALVHSAGVYASGPLSNAAVTDLDAMFASNLRAPFVLTQRLLAPLQRAGGYLIQINSSAAHGGGAGAGLYAALQHANRALADVWRQELNAKGIRVLSIYPGRTHTPRIERVFAREGRRYAPELLLQPDDIAAFVALAIRLPAHVELTDLSLRPAKKSY